MQLIIELPHQLPPQLVCRRLQSRLEEARRRHHQQLSDLRREWREQCGEISFRIYGHQAAVRVAVDSRRVRGTLQLPWIAWPLRRKIRARAERELQVLLARPANANETI